MHLPYAAPYQFKSINQSISLTLGLWEECDGEEWREGGGVDMEGGCIYLDTAFRYCLSEFV